jgi:hypothetical protein
LTPTGSVMLPAASASGPKIPNFLG